MNKKTFLDIVSSKINSSVNDVFGPEDILISLNEGLREISLRSYIFVREEYLVPMITPPVTDVNPTPTPYPSKEHKYPIGMSRILGVYLDGRSIPLMSSNEMDRLYPNWRRNNGNEVEAVILTSDIMIFYPEIKDYKEPFLIKGSYVPDSVLPDDDDDKEIPLDDIYINVALNYVCFELLNRQGRTESDLKSKNYFRLYREGLQNILNNSMDNYTTKPTLNGPLW